MSIKTKDWSIQHDLMPGIGCPTIRIHGTVTVANPGVKPVLVEARCHDKSFSLNLELKLEQEDGMFAQVQTDKAVCYEIPDARYHIPSVKILHEGEHLYTVTKIITTH